MELLNEKLIIGILDRLAELGFNKVYLDITGYEKTELFPSVDEDEKYYYQLPYSIDVEKTMKNFEKRDYLNGFLRCDESLYYDDIVIREDGKVSMNPTDEFVERFFQILGCIQRKDI